MATMRKPKVENKYKLKVENIKKFKILDIEKLKTQCWRNDTLKAWCYSADIGMGSSYVWVGFHDDGKIKVQCSCFEDMCNYTFNDFYNFEEIDNIFDLETQETLLKFANWLLDEKVVAQ